MTGMVVTCQSVPTNPEAVDFTTTRPQGELIRSSRKAALNLIEGRPVAGSLAKRSASKPQ